LSNQDQSDHHQPILHILSLYISPAEMVCFVLFFCNYLGGPSIAAATVHLLVYVGMCSGLQKFKKVL